MSALANINSDSNRSFANRLVRARQSKIFLRDRSSNDAQKIVAAMAQLKSTDVTKGLCKSKSPKSTQHRTIFISDTHLGTKGCRADLLLDFLQHNDCETLYLVGDIIDGWRLKSSWYWDDIHTAVIHCVLKKAREGTRVVYIPGNHDEGLRQFEGIDVARVELRNSAWHETKDGRKFVVCHGDDFDAVIRYAKWLAIVGDWAYGLALALNQWVNTIRRWFNLPYWSLSRYLKGKVKNAVEYISRYEVAVTQAAKQKGADGVICGHIHHPEIRTIEGTLYCNDGDWVESCSALVEDAYGNLEILFWTEFTTYQEQLAKDPIAA